jgi:phosphoglycolate phosphatase
LLIIFDLDGTLIDSSTDLAISMNATRRHFALEPLDPNLIYSFVGNGAPTLIRRAMPANTSEQQLNDALAYFLQFYRAHALEHTRLYPGIREAVEDLSDSGHKLAVLTNKPVRISSDIISALRLRERFVRIYGGDSFPQKKPNPIGILQLMQDTGARTSETLMVGDSAVDVQTARNAGIRSCGVLWGFQPESFDQEKPDGTVSRPEELLNFISDGTPYQDGNVTTP